LHNIRICCIQNVHIWSSIYVMLPVVVFIVWAVIKLCCFKASTLNLCNKGSWEKSKSKQGQDPVGHDQDQNHDQGHGEHFTFYIFEQLKCATHCALTLQCQDKQDIVGLHTFSTLFWLLFAINRVRCKLLLF